MVIELETTHDEDHLPCPPKPWVHVWPFPEIRKEQQRALLESKHRSFRFVGPFMSQGPQRARHFPDRPFLLGSDVDTSYLDEIQGIESLMLVPALVGTRALVGMRPC